MSSHLVPELLAGLKSRHTESRRKAVHELYHFAKTELREMPQETLTIVLDEFNHHIHSMLSSYDNNEKKGGLLTIGKNRVLIYSLFIWDL